MRTSGGAASFTGITNNGALTLSTGTTFSYGTGIAAAHRTALGLGSLATQSGTFSGTHSGDSSGTNTGDQDLSNFLSRRTILEVNGTDAPISQSLVEQDVLSNGRRYWASGDGGTLAYEEGIWVLTQLDSGSSFIYQASKTSTSYEPWLLTGWTVSTGSGEPTFVLDPAEPLGNGVIVALDLPVDTNGGFLTAGTGGTLPITRGGTGATTAGLARTALGSGATGDALFTAMTPAAARTTLGTLSATATGTTAAASTTTDVVSITIPGAGFWSIEVLATFENSGSSSTLFSVVFDAAAEIPATAFRIGTVQVSTSIGALSVLLPSRVATLGTTVSSAGLFNSSARGLIRTTGASVVTLRIANTVASGTTTAIQSALIATQL